MELMPEEGMEEREVLDNDGNVIVVVAMPIGTSEDKWARAMSGYLPTPPEEIEE